MKIIIVTGGTGGHIFPAVALAEELKNNSHDVYYAIDTRFKNIHHVDKKTMFVIESSSILPGVKGKVISLYKILKGFCYSVFLLYKIKPDIVIGFGGYTTFPCCIAAYILRIPLFIHEQNSVLGNANYILSKISTKILTSFKNTKSNKYKSKTVCVGNPVRASISKYRDYKNDKSNTKFVISILGGSLGAKFLSQNLAEIITSLPSKYRNNIKIIHQVIKSEIETVNKIYKNAKIQAETSNFFADIGGVINEADLVIARSGATTIAELSVLNTKAIFIPLKSFKDHQNINAEITAKNNMGWVISEKDLNFATKIKDLIINIIDDPNFLVIPKNNINQLAAAKNIVEEFKICLHKGEKYD